MFCNQFFIRSCNTFSIKQCFFYKSISRLHAAHTLYNNLNIAIFIDNIVIMNNFIRIRIFRKISQIQNIFYGNVLSYSLCNDCGIGLQYFYYT